ncbi:DUF2182 domain-containing protein [Marinobacter sp. JSM 1782161]|uniref:DUF2182 domain-containing protein n=1 Tax=Marinobacter sp. JSM 1782161 TaxID=2685906 RepID=UPI001A9E6EA1|nr:DUF2182 domain-containing protein [Marinobacter sp. JSM 1782161]
MGNVDSRALASPPLSRQSMALLGGVGLVILLSWWYLVDMALGMDSMASMGQMMTFRPWTATYAVMMFLMWAIMMMAMMLPSAIPMVLVHRQVAAYNRQPRQTAGTLLFVTGYGLVWVLFSVVATALQWLLEQWAILSPMMRSQSLVFSGVVLLLAGLYQWSPWKAVCLRHCRGPAGFIMQHWQPGLAGALRMGLVHGAYCVGCCSALMVLLFVGGVMDLLVIAGLTLVVLLEKVMPGGEWLARGLGVLSALAGSWLLVSALA